ncbi:aldehyde dehydrogenase family protein [bacterium]|nr:aldehyde dehydrogenase family protein [bacterium]
MALISMNPHDGSMIKEYEEMSESQVNETLQQTQEAFNKWKNTPFTDRTRRMFMVAKILRERKEEFAQLMTAEMGKPITGARAEVEKCTWVCEYYAEQAECFLKEEPIRTDAQYSGVVYRPLGVILAVMPWNYPFWQVFRFASPGLMAGNTCVLKHAGNVSGCALAIEEIFREAGFPSHAFRSLLISSSKVNPVIENPIVKAITLTGSNAAGKAVAQKAGEMLKKTVLELGGSDPYLILDDADLAKAVPLCVKSRLLNSGQSCIAAKRFIVVEDVREEFEQQFVEAMEKIVMGDPAKEETQLGPMARIDLRDELHKQVSSSVGKGARCLLGGDIPAFQGAYYPATVLTDVKQGMPAYEEELFGPVASIIPVQNSEEAVRVANDNIYGLGAAVFTENRDRGMEIAQYLLDAGSCFVNSFVKSDPRLPFGGVKESGYGRELSHFGIKEFTNIKTVYMD